MTTTREPSLRRAPLTQERVLRVTLDLLDREGLEAISMRKVASELGVEAMSLYNHVENKAALFDGLVDLIVGEVGEIPRATSWMLALRSHARAFRSVLRAHPHALPLFTSHASLTPKVIAKSEEALGVLKAAGFPAEDALRTLDILLAFIIGHALSSYASSARAAPLEINEYASPHVAEVIRSRETYDRERAFEVGLDALLVGLSPAPVIGVGIAHGNTPAPSSSRRAR